MNKIKKNLKRFKLLIKCLYLCSIKILSGRSFAIAYESDKINLACIESKKVTDVLFRVEQNLPFGILFENSKTGPVFFEDEYLSFFFTLFDSLHDDKKKRFLVDVERTTLTKPKINAHGKNEPWRVFHVLSNRYVITPKYGFNGEFADFYSSVIEIIQQCLENKSPRFLLAFDLRTPAIFARTLDNIIRADNGGLHYVCSTQEPLSAFLPDEFKIEEMFKKEEPEKKESK